MSNKSVMRAKIIGDKKAPNDGICCVHPTVGGRDETLIHLFVRADTQWSALHEDADLLK